jgi:integrase
MLMKDSTVALPETIECPLCLGKGRLGSTEVLERLGMKDFARGTQLSDFVRRKRKKGPDVWQFRYSEKGKRNSVLIGTVEKLPHRADAERAVEHLRMRINRDDPQQRFHSVTVGGLIDRFMEEYAPRVCRPNTQRDYRHSFKNHVRLRWGSVFIQNVKTMAVQDWLDSYPHSRQVKAHIRRYMHVLFNQAVRWELLERNPITLVKQSGKRLKTPRALKPEEFKAL